MRIALLSPGYPPGAGGGIGANAATVAKALAAAGHEVLIVAWVRGPEQRFRDGDVSVLLLERRPRKSHTTMRLLAAARIARAVRRFRPDVVQAPEYFADAWVLARTGAGKRLATRLATPTFLLERLNDVGPRPQTRVLRWLERDQARRSAAIVAPTRAIADLVGGEWGLDGARIHVVPNPIDAAAVRAAGQAAPPVELPERFVAFPARAERRKGADVLAQALPRALAAAPDVHVLFVGGGTPATIERLTALAEPVAERVRFLEHLPRDQALAVVARAELVVLPSLWENFSNAALEAMALARPLIVTDAGGFPEFVTDAETGWLVPPGDSDSLAASMSRALADPAAAENVGQRAAESLARLAPDVVARELLALYERLG